LNRRNSLKGIASLVLMSATSVSIYEWINSGSKIDFNLLIEKKALIAELAECIIPRTSTPGAKDAKVEDFILSMLKTCTPVREQHTFLDGLKDMETYALENYNTNFINCSSTNKTEILAYFEDKATYNTRLFNKINNKFLGKPFFIKLKELTVKGYCNSQIGATMALAYDYVPSTYQACVRLADHQPSWATK
jgi:hypothetical protein